MPTTSVQRVNGVDYEIMDKRGRNRIDNVLESLHAEMPALTPYVAGKYYAHNSTTWLNSPTTCLVPSPIRLQPGRKYYYHNLYAYFCNIKYDGGSTVALSDSTADENVDGSFVPAGTGELYVTIRSVNGETPIPGAKIWTMSEFDDLQIEFDTAVSKSVYNIPGGFQFGHYYGHGTTSWITSTFMGTLPPIPIYKGRSYFYKDLYAYFCNVKYMDGRIFALSETVADYASGIFTPEMDGTLYVSVHCEDGQQTPVQTAELYSILLVSGEGSGSDEKVIRVGFGQDFTTLRAGIAEGIKTRGTRVIVYPGTYDLTQEFAAEISAASGTVGIVLDNDIYVEFLAGSYVKALFPTSSDWISTYFNPFRGKDFTLDGLNIEVSNCRYCVHDEQSGQDVKYRNVYKNCIMKNTVDREESGVTGDLFHQCIGGGLGMYGYIEITGGEYTSIRNDSEYPFDENPNAISYHNGISPGCDSKIYIRDVYLGEDSIFRFGYYGESTIKTPVFISGCSMGGAIVKRAEASGWTKDNFEIIEWNNTVRT